MYSLSLENEPTSSNSHSTRNKKWKSWVGWHDSSCWLLCLCVLCFVFCAVSKTIRWSRVSPISLFQKNEKLWAINFGGFLCYNQKKKVLVVCLVGCAVVSVFGSGDYDRKKKFKSSVWRVVLLCQFLVLAITTGKKKVLVVCLAGCANVSVFGSGGK